MDVLLPARQPLVRHSPHPSPSTCERRGYCGPFANEAYYNAFPEPVWHGMGDCLECGTTRRVDRGPRPGEEVSTAA